MVKLFIIPPNDGGEDGIYQLVTEDGLGLASHLCSNRSFATSDLLTGRAERLEQWAEYLKDGYEIEFATETKNEELFALNQKNFLTEEAREKYMRETMKMKEEDIASSIS